MSSRTRPVAVAVRAMNGTPVIFERSSRIWRYSGRKSWPHSLMQWASSTATQATPQRFRSSIIEPSMSRSGAR